MTEKPLSPDRTRGIVIGEGTGAAAPVESSSDSDRIFVPGVGISIPRADLDFNLQHDQQDRAVAQPNVPEWQAVVEGIEERAPQQ